ncbi:MAG: hypothetical protein HZA03_05130, partial [Nitrospinae bacterium]|nr:hypothetical protein [Nitrospinota bacterium]
EGPDTVGILRQLRVQPQIRDPHSFGKVQTRPEEKRPPAGVRRGGCPAFKGVVAGHRPDVFERKLVEKTKVNSKYIKKYDTPATPYQRLPDSSHAADEAKEKLRAVHATLNPFHLKKEIEKKLRGFFNDLRLPES